MSRTVEMIQYESYSSSFNVLNVLTGDVFFWAAGEETGESEIGLISWAGFATGSSSSGKLEYLAINSSS